MEDVYKRQAILLSHQLSHVASGTNQLSAAAGIQPVSYTHLDVYKRQHQGHALLIIDDLSVNVLGGAESIQARTCCGAADLVANAAMTTKTSSVLVDLRCV